MFVRLPSSPPGAMSNAFSAKAGKVSVTLLLAALRSSLCAQLIAAICLISKPWRRCKVAVSPHCQREATSVAASSRNALNIAYHHAYKYAWPEIKSREPWKYAVLCIEISRGAFTNIMMGKRICGTPELQFELTYPLSEKNCSARPATCPHSTVSPDTMSISLLRGNGRTQQTFPAASYMSVVAKESAAELEFQGAL